MNDFFELNNVESKLEYIKISAPSIYKKIVPELENKEKPYDLKSEIAIGKSVLEAFELSGNQAIITTPVYDVPAIKKLLTKERNIHISGNFKVIDDLCFSNCSNLETVVFEEGVECIK